MTAYVAVEVLVASQSLAIGLSVLTAAVGAGMACVLANRRLNRLAVPPAVRVLEGVFVAVLTVLRYESLAVQGAGVPDGCGRGRARRPDQRARTARHRGDRRRDPHLRDLLQHAAGVLAHWRWTSAAAPWPPPRRPRRPRQTSCSGTTSNTCCRTRNCRSMRRGGAPPRSGPRSRGARPCMNAACGYSRLVAAA